MGLSPSHGLKETMTEDDMPILTAPPPEHWDEAFAQTLVGKIMLVNLTLLDAEGELQGREAFHGVVITADADEGLLLDLLGRQDGDTTTLPPQTSNITAAAPGLYPLADGETVENPDFLSSWTIAGPEEPANEE